ncbi:hypothetical protein JF544_18815 [Halobacillus kuroshimensis]|uniref:Uncharacterized protein n=1 Tax=Halobacillus kuroshimensis TaxID=302481 RepID=A0ABS3E123_9BACI|nr:hypothetical protein [Halobacillus kuroshimensis]MBN8237300.1 hypothetical protein [Halobacillus kuroshimensis]
MAIIEAYDNQENKYKVVFDACYIPYVLEGNPNSTFKVEVETAKKTHKNQYGSFGSEINTKVKGVFKKDDKGNNVYLKDIILNPDKDERVYTIDNPLNLTLDNLLLIREA